MTEENKTNDFITVAVFDYAHELIIIRSRLESEGVECKTVDELTVQVNPLYSQAIGGIKLQVKKSDVIQAIEILKEGGHVTDKDFEKSSPKIISYLDLNTSKIPFLKEVQFEIRVMILVSSLVLIISLVAVLLNGNNSY